MPLPLREQVAVIIVVVGHAADLLVLVEIIRDIVGRRAVVPCLDTIAGGVVGVAEVLVREGEVGREKHGVGELAGRVVLVGPLSIEGRHAGAAAQVVIGVIELGIDAAVGRVIHQVQEPARGVVAVGREGAIAQVLLGEAAGVIVVVLGDQAAGAVGEPAQPARRVVRVVLGEAVLVRELRAPAAVVVGVLEESARRIGHPGQPIGVVVGVERGAGGVGRADEVAAVIVGEVVVRRRRE